MASFTRTYSDQDLRVLLQAVVDAEAADHALTQSEYDKAREAHGYEHTPRAKYIAKRLGSSWQSLAAKALQSQATDSQRAKAESKATDNGNARRQPSEIISQAVARHALGTIHRRLGAETISAIQYERERQAMIASAADREEAHSLDEALPSAQRLQTVYKTWAGACQAAGIKAPEGAHKSREHVNPGSYDLEGAKWAMLEALAWAAGQGRELTQRAYQEYAGEVEGIPSLNALQGLLKREGLGTFATFRSSVQRDRLKQGL